MIDRAQDWFLQAKTDLERMATQAGRRSSIMVQFKAIRQSNMPVRSLNSSVFEWPDQETVVDSLHTWVKQLGQERPELLRVGFFGSYARGDWGVSSDLDLILIVQESQVPFWQRALEWDTLGLPVPVDILVYTQEEWKDMGRQGERFYQTIQKEAIWVYEKGKVIPRREDPA
jgi:predicted nucleotidyltransferase